MDNRKKLINDAISEELQKKICDRMKATASDAIEEVLGEYVGRYLNKERYENCDTYLWYLVAYVVDHDISKIFKKELLLEEYLNEYSN